MISEDIENGVISIGSRVAALTRGAIKGAFWTAVGILTVAAIVAFAPLVTSAFAAGSFTAGIATIGGGLLTATVAAVKLFAASSWLIAAGAGLFAIATQIPGKREGFDPIGSLSLKDTRDDRSPALEQTHTLQPTYDNPAFKEGLGASSLARGNAASKSGSSLLPY